MTFSFFLLRLVPGGPFDSEASLDPYVRKSLEMAYGLDLPVWEQFLNFLRQLVQGNLGESMKNPRTMVSDVFLNAFPTTFFLSLVSFLISFFASVIWAGWISLNPSSIFSRLSLVAAKLGISLPVFFLAVLLIYFFSIQNQIFDPALSLSPSSYFLPIVTLTFRPTCQLFLLFEKRLAQEIREDYVRTAIGKGLSLKKILRTHVLKNVLPTLLPNFGFLLISLFSGSLVVETVFSLPGLGHEVVRSVNQRDFTLFSGLLLYSYFLVFVVSGLIDFFSLKLDVRRHP